jgi:hypothetical protein
MMRFKSTLAQLEQVALLPLGDRCTARMLLHKCQFDGPCYPFDLTRCTHIGDVTDIIRTDFTEMWDADLLEYDGDKGRIFHKKWESLSFAHEVEDGDDPIMEFGKVAKRMAKRYTGRASRFRYACEHADKVMFIRTGLADQEEVEDLMCTISDRFPGIKSHLLLISDQSSEDFADMSNVTHVRQSWDPDRMYDDYEYWMSCAGSFGRILDEVGVNSLTLYWCPNDVKLADQEAKQPASEALKLMRRAPSRNLSHSRLLDSITLGAKHEQDTMAPGSSMPNHSSPQKANIKVLDLKVVDKVPEVPRVALPGNCASEQVGGYMAGNTNAQCVVTNASDRDGTGEATVEDNAMASNETGEAMHAEAERADGRKPSQENQSGEGACSLGHAMLTPRAFSDDDDDVHSCVEERDKTSDDDREQVEMFEQEQKPPERIQGFLGKKGKGGMFRKAWNSKYCVLQEGVFVYYSYKSDFEGNPDSGKRVDFSLCDCEAIPEETDKCGTQFIIRPKSGRWVGQAFDELSDDRLLLFDTKDLELSRSEWIAAINIHCQWATRLPQKR